MSGRQQTAHEAVRQGRWRTLREDSGWETYAEADSAMNLNPGAWEILENQTGWKVPLNQLQAARDIEKALNLVPDWLQGYSQFSKVVKPGSTRRGRASGRTYVDAWPAQVHLDLAVHEYGYAMSEDDHGCGYIGEFLNIGSDECLSRLINAKKGEVLIDSEFSKGLLEIPLNPKWRAPSAIGAQRRLRGLLAWGYSPSVLRNRLSMQKVVFDRTVFGSGTVPLNIKMGSRVSRLFIELELEPGTSRVGRGLADKYGWELPFQWDEEAIDRRAAKPGYARTEEDEPREYTPAERQAIIGYELSRHWGY
ncbi:hypothetical protein BJD55_gp109 [Gordonia phage Yvonnetastic]|uniref:Uncharacterized protein n=1 Tax=Gordonia phage Yvonnetastic TaxID=1821566 RepID=A0A142K974_9CAUD|nr:hypothetical protein BJD55_gp109 [Gordonia phage Yvonnetastic]AMS02657.1 hypothetical protein SEA_YVONNETASTIC_113 [Gordonia phage Yvonnetastic]